MTDSPVSDYSNPELNAIVLAVEAKELKENAEKVVTPPPTAVYRSVCTSSTARITASRFKVPPEFDLCAPADDHTIDSPPPGYAAISTVHFRYGLRLPLPPLVVSVLDHYRISLAQLHPNCVIYILGFLEVCKRASIEPSLTLFRHFFQLKICSHVKDESYTFGQTARQKLVYGIPSSGVRWKTYILFFKTERMKMKRGAFCWNHSLVTDEPVAEEERPSEVIVDKLLANAFEYQVPLAGEKSGLDVPIVSSSRKKAAQRIRAKKSVQRMRMSNGGLKRSAEPLATPAAKARRDSTRKKNCVDESSQIQGQEIALLDSANSKHESVSDDEIASLKAEVSRLQGVVDDRGSLLKVYTWKLLKTEGFASFLYQLTSLAQSLGQTEAAELMLERFPAIPEEALAGLQDPQAAFKLDNQFFNMIQDAAFDFPLLDHLLSLEEIPCSSQLKQVNVDEDQDAFVPPSPPHAN